MFKFDLRIALMLATFVLGVVLLIWGWTMTGKMAGLLIMLAGVALLLGTLALYNHPYADKKK